MNPNNSRRKLYFIAIGAALIIALLFMLPSALRGVKDRATQADPAAQTSAEQGSAAEDAGTGTGTGNGTETEAPLAVIFCASDYQAEPGWDTPAENLSAILDSAIEGLAIPEDTGGSADAGSTLDPDDPARLICDCGAAIDSIIMCGDYTNDARLYDYQLSPDDSISEIKDIVGNKLPYIDDSRMLFVQGNHDALTGSISESGLHEYDEYLVYVINTENDFPWKQGKVSGALDKVRKTSEDLRSCLSELTEKGEKRPVIIASHVPLHFTARTSSKHSTGDNLYSSLIFNAVNDAADSLDIIYLYGHNHSKGWDCYMGGSSVFRAPGESILIPEFEESDLTTDEYTPRELGFTYLNAGYTGYFMNCGTAELEDGTWHDYDAADCTLTGTLIMIYPDKIAFSRWDKDGMHVMNGQGEGDPYQGGIDADLIPESEYADEIQSPQIISRKK